MKITILAKNHKDGQEFKRKYSDFRGDRVVTTPNNMEGLTGFFIETENFKNNKYKKEMDRIFEVLQSLSLTEKIK